MNTESAVSGPGDRVLERLRQILTLARPTQWLKNLLVLAAPAAAGALDHALVIGRSLLLVVAFTAASIAVYAINDVRDADLDRLHPLKQYRPVASGTLSQRAALGLALTAAAGALVIAGALGVLTFATLAAYLVVSGLYSLRLKHIPVLDIIAVATGFVLRALSGAAANHLVVSNWFLLVSLFGALYLITGKRSA